MQVVGVFIRAKQKLHAGLVLANKSALQFALGKIFLQYRALLRGKDVDVFACTGAVKAAFCFNDPWLTANTQNVIGIKNKFIM